jgi:HK97 family phage major capsid protein
MSAALIEARRIALENMEALAATAAERTLTDDEQKRFDGFEAEIADLDKRSADQERVAALRKSQPAAAEARGVEAVAKQSSAGTTSVREVSPYGEKAEGQSWFADVRTLRDREASNAEVDEARSRLTQHYAASNDEGGARQARALSTTTDSEGGYLVAPVHLQNEFARYLVAGATTVGLVSQRPLAPKTTLIKIPKQDGATVVAQHTQNNALTETSATFTTVNATVYRYGGAQTIPNMLLDRSLPGVDGIVLADLGRQLALKVNSDIINGTTPEGILAADGIGTATATAGTAVWGDLYPALVNAIMDVSTAHYAGTADLSIVMHPRRWGWILAQLDSEDRPLVGSVMPNNAPAAFAGVAGPEADSGGPRPVGYVLGIPVYLDSTIPTTADTDQDRIIVGAFREAHLFQAAPKFGISTEAEFLKDQTLVRVTQDIAFTAERYPGAFSVISGTALNDL